MLEIFQDSTFPVDQSTSFGSIKNLEHEQTDIQQHIKQSETTGICNLISTGLFLFPLKILNTQEICTRLRVLILRHNSLRTIPEEISK
jgi:hypothetical protein